MQVPTIEQFEEQQRQLNILLQQFDAMKAREERRLQEPGPWLLQNEARKLFIGRGGEPVTRHTFLKMIRNWIKERKLIEEVSIRTSGNMRFISKEFLKGQLPERKKMKAA